MTERDEFAELAAPYALGALDTEERGAYEAFLDESGGQTDDFAGVTESLALAAEPVEPTASMKAALMSQLTSTPQLPADDAASAAVVRPGEGIKHATSAPTTKAAGAAASAKKSKAQLKAERHWYTRPLAAVVAAVAIVVAMFGANLLTSAFNGGNGLSQSLALAQVNAQTDVQRHLTKLSGLSEDRPTTMTLVWSENIGRSAVVIDGMAQLSDEKTYELWYMGDNGSVSAGLFNTDRSGDAWFVLDGVMRSGDSIGITIEPVGGSDQPTTEPLVVIPTV